MQYAKLFAYASRLFMGPRRIAMYSLMSLGGTYALLKSRMLAKPHERAPGDYSVTVDRSGGGL